MEKHDEHDSQAVEPVIIGEGVLLVRNIIVFIVTTIFFLHQASIIQIGIVDVQDEGDLFD